MNSYRVQACIVVALALSGCATKWYKPGASSQQFYADSYDCQREVAAAHPPAPTSMGPGIQAPTQTRCTTSYGGVVNCTSTPGMYTPGPVVDFSGAARAFGMEACLRARGYTKQ